MLRKLRAWALALASLALAPAVHAACPTPTLTGLTGKDASSITQTLMTIIPPGQTQQAAVHINEAFNGSTYAPMLADANCDLQVGAPDGAFVTLGSQSDAAWTTGNGTVISLLKGLMGSGGQLHTDLQTLNTTAGNPAKLADSGGGDVSDATNHALVVEQAFNGRFVQAPVSLTTLSLTTLVAAQGAGLYTYVTDLDCENSGQFSFSLNITNSAAQSLYTLIVPAGAGWVKSFVTPLGGNGQMATNTALSITPTLVGPQLSAPVSTGTYNTGTGVVSLTVPAGIPFGSGWTVTVSNLTGTGAFASFNGTFTTTSGTGGTTVNYIVAGQAASTITGGTVTFSPVPSIAYNVQGRVRNQ